MRPAGGPGSAGRGAAPLHQGSRGIRLQAAPAASRNPMGVSSENWTGEESEAGGGLRVCACALCLAGRPRSPRWGRVLGPPGLEAAQALLEPPRPPHGAVSAQPPLPQEAENQGRGVPAAFPSIPSSPSLRALPSSSSALPSLFCSLPGTSLHLSLPPWGPAPGRASADKGAAGPQHRGETGGWSRGTREASLRGASGAAPGLSPARQEIRRSPRR